MQCGKGGPVVAVLSAKEMDAWAAGCMSRGGTRHTMAELDSSSMEKRILGASALLVQEESKP
ncbi:hypothetical protein AWM70_20560 [Paenibacillus yonginensis]|uniref:Uncharacterized protein n=1 Tax=Paenibacillus yonginensis TaxID=1462996 RepID=A0A1B1N5L9_9BACL|nr:hypothetical protein AWM70_20560 [Paenibacillus yonginensis]